MRHSIYQEEASRGYFDDFKELRDSKGKLFESNRSVIPANEAQLVPHSEVSSSSSFFMSA